VAEGENHVRAAPLLQLDGDTIKAGTHLAT
jgi:hypothetical protein